MIKDINDYVHGCLKCELWSSVQKHSELFKPSMIIHSWEAVEADLASFPTRRGFSYLLVVVDVFSRFVMVEPLKNAETETIVAALRRMFTTTVYPLLLSYDHGTEFARVLEWLKTKGVRAVQGPTASERITGAVEAIIRSLRRNIERSLQLQVDERGHPVNTLMDWPEQAYEEAMNWNHHHIPSPGFAPVKIVYRKLESMAVDDREGRREALVELIERERREAGRDDGLITNAESYALIRVVNYLTEKLANHRKVQLRDASSRGRMQSIARCA